MTRVPLVAGNWKMNKTINEGVALVKELLPRVEGLAHAQVAVCPPFTALNSVGMTIAGSSIALGAQDVFWAESGAFTGMISPVMLKELDCTYVIIGHSERRGRFGIPDESLPAGAANVFGDNDTTVNLKLHAALQHRLVPIVCVGETLPEREAEQTDAIVGQQVRNGLAGLTEEQVAGLVLAYEPVWAIGTGRACDAEEANRVCGLIRSVVADIFGKDAANALRIQYGGSMTPDNAHELISQPDIDGGLVGGASLDAVKFAQIIQAASVIAKETRYS